MKQGGTAEIKGPLHFNKNRRRQKKTIVLNGNYQYLFLCISGIGTSMLVRAWTAASPSLDAQRNQSITWITLSMWWSGCLSFTHDEETWRSTSFLHQAPALSFWPGGESSTRCTSHVTHSESVSVSCSQCQSPVDVFLSVQFTAWVKKKSSA